MLATSEFRYCPNCKAACTRRVGFYWRIECYRCSNKFCWVCLGPIQHAIPFTCLNETFIAKQDWSVAFTMAVVFVSLLLVHVLAVIIPFLTCLYLIFFDVCFIPAESTRSPTFISIQYIRKRLSEGKLPFCFKEQDTGSNY